MSELAKYFFIISFFISVVYLPWWVTVSIAIVLLSVWRTYATVMLGALCLDILFGSPLAAFGGFAYLYTAIFALLVFLSFFLNRTMLE
jgi:putative Ca2+/H+ antiporter (TMEM165/GDT1 family)